MATSIELTPDAEKRLDFLASRTGRSKDFYLRELVERGLEDLEDYYLAADVFGTPPQRGRKRVFSRHSKGNPCPGRLSTPKRP